MLWLESAKPTGDVVEQSGQIGIHVTGEKIGDGDEQNGGDAFDPLPGNARDDEPIEYDVDQCKRNKEKIVNIHILEPPHKFYLKVWVFVNDDFGMLVGEGTRI